MKDKVQAETAEIQKVGKNPPPLYMGKYSAYERGSLIKRTGRYLEMIEDQIRMVIQLDWFYVLELLARKKSSM